MNGSTSRRTRKNRTLVNCERLGRCVLHRPLLGRSLSCLALLRLALVGLAAVVGSTNGGAARAQTAPKYEECRLDSIFPAGGRRGAEVRVEFRGTQGGLQSPTSIVIDGPSGVTVKSVRASDASTAVAELTIAPDAPLGRRWLRVASERSGLTNFAHFVVGALPETVEQEPNDRREQAQAVEAPSVVNGRVNPKTDADWYRFSVRAGRRVVAAVAAHALDVHGQGSNYGIADFRLELFDASGRSLASSEDALGLDPLVEWQASTDAELLVRVELLNHGGFPEAVYRLTLGDVPYVTSVYPSSVRRGESTELELAGPNVPPGSKVRFTAPADVEAPQAFVTLDHPASSGCDLPVTWSDEAHRAEVEPNSTRETAEPLEVGAAVVGRFETAGDEDWYRVRLAARQSVWFETTAHRWTRSPVDTRIALFDAEGRPVAENDDDATFDPGYESIHDFKTTDSRLFWQAPAAGEYRVRVTDEAGATGRRAVYRLSVTEPRPDFQLRHFPDAVPIWGAGGTACLLVKIDRLGGMQERIELTVEGLPAGWIGSTNVSQGATSDRPNDFYHRKAFLSITAPPDAPMGAPLPLRIVGRATIEGRTVERGSWPLTLFYTSDTGFFRVSPRSRVVVAQTQGPRLEALVKELSLPAGGAGTIPVRAAGTGDATQLPLVVNLASGGVACVLTTPQTLPIQDGRIDVPVKLPPELPPGEYGAVVALQWRSDVRVGMPGPCTSLVRIVVRPAAPSR